MRIKIPYLLTVIISILLIIIGHKIAVKGMPNFHNASFEIVKATVQRSVERIELTDTFEPDFEEGYFYDDYLPIQGYQIIFEAKIRDGLRKGEIVRAIQSYSDLMKDTTKEVRKGDYVLLIDTGMGWYFNGYVRVNKLLGLGLLFVVCVLFFGGKKGFNTILSLGLTCSAVFAVFIPAILTGKNIYVVASLVCAYTTMMTLLIVIGFNKKSLSASVGCISGIIVTAIITLIMDKLLILSGIVDEHSRYLAYLPVETPINLRAIIFAGIIIGAMGAIMDVAMSIASSLWEVKEKAGKINFETLFRSGLNIGRDIMGSMANTLILAYIGTSLSVVLLLSVYTDSLSSLLNMEMIAVEILQALAGSFGILFAMPLTAFFCATIYLKK
jgi:uncharacterized membrane protein